MSIVAPSLAIRNMLRDPDIGLPNFYNNEDTAKQALHRRKNCRIMPDDRPAPDCGREFISIYTSAWNPIVDGVELYGLHEDVTVTIAVTQKCGDVPFDQIGEVVYMNDEDVYVSQFVSLAQRIRQIIDIIHPDYINFNAQMAAILIESVDDVDKGLQPQYDKLRFAGADPRPKIVGPDHFHAVNASQAPTGLMMRAHFNGAGRLHNMASLDQPEA